MILEAPWLTAPESLELMEVLTEGDVPARFVGGCVRDALLGDVDPDVDLDVATPLLPEQVIERLEAAGIKAIPTGIEHGTVTALVRDQPFEITTLRKDVACDGRHAEVEFTADFREDAARRDFTINAMSTDWQGQLVDYFGGVADLKAGRIRFVGDAGTRVREDYLRILRFFRFFARFGRPPADREAIEACRAGAAGLPRLSGERIRNEMLKLLASGGATTSLTLMIETGVLRHVLPIDADLTALARLIAIAPDSDPILRLAALLRSGAGGVDIVQAAVGGWRLSNADRERLERLTREPLLDLPLAETETRKKIHHLGKDACLDLLKLSARSREELDAALPLPETPPFPLSGQDLIDRRVPPGPELGALLREVEDWWLDQGFEPDRGAALRELDRRLAKP